jgi:hypothetical protein
MDKRGDGDITGQYRAKAVPRDALSSRAKRCVDTAEFLGEHPRFASKDTG